MAHKTPSTVISPPETPAYLEYSFLSTDALRIENRRSCLYVHVSAHSTSFGFVSFSHRMPPVVGPWTANAQDQKAVGQNRRCEVFCRSLRPQRQSKGGPSPRCSSKAPQGSRRRPTCTARTAWRNQPAPGVDQTQRSGLAGNSLQPQSSKVRATVWPCPFAVATSADSRCFKAPNRLRRVAACQARRIRKAAARRTPTSSRWRENGRCAVRHFFLGTPSLVELEVPSPGADRPTSASAASHGPN